MPHTKARRLEPQVKLEPAKQHCWQARKADVLIVTPRVAPTCQTWSLTKALVTRLEASQRATERNMLIKCQAKRLRNMSIKERTRVTDIVEYVAKAKWKWVGHAALMKDTRCTTRSTEWQTCLLVGCLTSQQHASVSQGRICTDNSTCCHTEIEAADQTFHLTQSQYTDTGPTSSSADPITPGAWQGSHWSANV